MIYSIVTRAGAGASRFRNPTERMRQEDPRVAGTYTFKREADYSESRSTA